jgi:glycosyltransferase involved in cell wall biosynthesis
MRIAMLVHNGVSHDARVIKSATTLAKAGYDVVVHGISRSDEAEFFRLEPVGVPVHLTPPVPFQSAASRGTRGHASYWRRAFLAALAATTVLLNFLVANLGISSAAALFLMTVLNGCSAFAFFKNRMMFNAAAAWIKKNYKNIPLLVGVCAGAVAYSFFAYWSLRSLGSSSLWGSILGLGALFALSLEGLVLVRRVHPRLQRYSHALARLVFSSPVGAAGLKLNYGRLAGALVESVGRHASPDLVHIHDAVALTAAGDLKRRYGCPIVWDAHEIYEDMANLDKGRAAFVRSLLREAQGHVGGFVTINESIAAFYRRNYPALPAPTVVMNATVAAEPPVYDGRLHDAAGLPRDRKIVLFQGGFAPKRGLSELVRAAASFDSRWTLVMMGWGPMEEELRKLAASLPSARDDAATVFVPGAPQEELQLWTAGGTVGLIPYENTGLNHLYCTPNKLWEYPNAGVPILCSDLVEMSRMVTEHGTGRLIPRDFTAEDIAAAVNALTDEDLVAMRENCAAFVRTNNWSVYEPRLLALYRSLGVVPDENAAGTVEPLRAAVG